MSLPKIIFCFSPSTLNYFCRKKDLNWTDTPLHWQIIIMIISILIMLIAMTENMLIFIIIIIIIVHSLELFTSAIADGFSLKSEWQLVSSSLLDSIFSSLARSRYLSFFSHSFSFILWSAGRAKSNILQVLFFFFLLIIIKSGLLAGIRWSVCISKSHRMLCESFSRTGAGLCIYHLLVWSNLNFLRISQWITLPTKSCLALYSRCANLLHSLNIWLMVSSLSPHSLHLLFCCVLSILALRWFVLMALSCAAIRRDSVSLLKFPFLSHVQVLSCEILLISRLKRP